VPLPGTSALERFQELSDARIGQTLTLLALKPQHQRAFIDSVAAPRRPVEGTGVVRLAELIKLAGMQPFPIDRELINYPDAAIRLAGLIDLELGAAEKAEPAGADDATSGPPAPGGGEAAKLSAFFKPRLASLSIAFPVSREQPPDAGALAE
jgi:hypothetical protein